VGINISIQAINKADLKKIGESFAGLKFNQEAGPQSHRKISLRKIF
jgi:hypothetical protein